MTSYTVEVTTAPAPGGDFSAYYRAIDAVPGTIVVEDVEAPVLIVPVEAASPLKAARFVDGLAKLVQLEPVSGRIYPTPEVDFELDDDDEPVHDTRTMAALSKWVDQESAPRPEVRELLAA